MKAYAIDINTARNSYFEAMNISPLDDYDRVNINLNFKIKCYQNSTEENSDEYKSNKSPENLYGYLIQKCPNILSEQEDKND